MTAPSTQVTTLLTQFNLTTASEELVPRLTQAGHHDALPVLLEVFEAEAEARRQRRIAGRIPDFPVTRSHPPASWPSAANSSICRTYRKTAGEESRRRSPVANRWMRP